MSRDAKYSTLAEIIEAANRFEQSFPPLQVLSCEYVDPFREDKAMLSNKRCYNCNQPGHVKKNCPTTYNPRKEHKPKLSPPTPKFACCGIKGLPHTVYFLTTVASFLASMYV